MPRTGCDLTALLASTAPCVGASLSRTRALATWIFAASPKARSAGAPSLCHPQTHRRPTSWTRLDGRTCVPFHGVVAIPLLIGGRLPLGGFLPNCSSEPFITPYYHSASRDSTDNA